MDSPAELMALAQRLRDVRLGLGGKQSPAYLAALDMLLLETRALNRSAAPRNYKPSEQWESTPHQQPLTTTSQNAFLPPHAIIRRRPFLPKANKQNPLTASRSERFMTRSTSADSFQSLGAIPRVQPFCPKASSGAFDLGEDATGTYSTTSRTSYLPHRVQPFVAARGPKSNLAVSKK